MKYQKRVNKIKYGGDYNPEQGPPEIWEQDTGLFRDANIDIVTLNVFNWALVQPSEDIYDFSALDIVVDRVTRAGLSICMATATAAHPPWMAHRHPDILRTECNGMKRKYGGRHNSCPNSPAFQKYSAALAEKLAEHYKNQENIILWHVNNEYGGACYCHNCEKEFRRWLQQKYGSIENLNREWNGCFWGHIYYDWEEIVLPSLLSEQVDEKRSMHQGITIDYRRFNSDSMLRNFMAERDAIKKYLPEAVVTTNLMGFYQSLDYHQWAKQMDIVSWDSYPEPGDAPARTAMSHDLMRGLKGGEPFLLMEQTPSVANWSKDTSLKRPGVMRLLSYQAVAHGADAVMFFQMRRSPSGCEKFHGALIDHAGSGSTRVFKECARLGTELERLKEETIGAKTKAEAALIFDWDTWWALECSVGPTTRLDYKEEFYHYYQAFFQMNIPVDIISMEDDFSGYKLIAAPLLYMIKGDIDHRLKDYAGGGGRIILTCLSGYVNENDYVTTGGYPGKLRELAGIWVEETDAPPEGRQNYFWYQNHQYPAQVLCDIIHLEGAEQVSAYHTDFYAGEPVITRNVYGKGVVDYVGTQSTEEFYQVFLKNICKEAGIRAIHPEADGEFEVTVREKDQQYMIFLLNHGNQQKRFTACEAGMELLTGRNISAGEKIILDGKDVNIIKIQKKQEDGDGICKNSRQKFCD